MTLGKEEGGKVTDDELEAVAGRREELVGRIQDAYGLSREEVERLLAAWQTRQR